MATKRQAASVEERLQQLRDELNEEMLRLSVGGRALSPQEERRLNALNQVVPDLDDAIGVLREAAQAEADPLEGPGGWADDQPE